MTMKGNGKIAVGLALAALALFASPAYAASAFFVNSTADAVDASPGDGKCATASGVCTLRAAIQEANALTGKDFILIPAGTYVLTLAGAGENYAATGDLDIRGDVDIKGSGAGVTIIDGNNADRVFEIPSLSGSFNTPPIVSVSGVTITNGNSGTAGGGGLQNYDSRVTVNLSDCEVAGNQAGSFGGGVRNTGYMTIAHCTITSNTAHDGGGGVDTGNLGTSVLTVTHSSITNNAAIGGGGSIGVGGGIEAYYTLRVLIINSLIAGNASGNSGGGVAGTRFVIQNSAIVSNTAGTDGGGLWVTTQLTATNTTIVSNTASAGSGGGVYFYSLSLVSADFNNTTIVSNTAGDPANSSAGGGGINNGFNVPITMKNSLLAGNIDRSKATIKAPDCYNTSAGKFVSMGHNLIGNNSGCAFTTDPSDQVGTSASPINPLVGTLADNGGPTLTLTLLEGSPALSGGDPATCAPADQRGAARNGTCDIGAYESGVTAPPADAALPDTLPAGTLPPAARTPVIFNIMLPLIRK